MAGLRAAWGRDWDQAGACLAVLLAAMGWEVAVGEFPDCPDGQEPDGGVVTGG